MIEQGEEMTLRRRILMTLPELQKQALQIPINDRWKLVQIWVRSYSKMARETLAIWFLQ